MPKRVLWLLNHKTLAEFEVPLLLSLGFEVFCPKIIPTSGFRSGAVTFEVDDSLTIPARDLRILNRTNFYTGAWADDVVRIANEHFDAAFAIPHLELFAQVVENFRGAIGLRAFGVESNRTYHDALRVLYGEELLRRIDRIADVEKRLWFAPGYDHLHEIEPGVLNRCSVYLPIGMPSAAFAHANTWSGSDERILFVCPDIVKSPYYEGIYRAFKASFGNLPHIIVGQQEVPVEDANVAGYVSSARLLELYQTCRALYYPSTEPNHVHYSPLEAAAVGMPVVYREGSLLHALEPEVRLGVAKDSAEAHALLLRLLKGDPSFVGALREEQKIIVRRFTKETCSNIWKENLALSGFLTAMHRPKPRPQSRFAKRVSSLAARARSVRYKVRALTMRQVTMGVPSLAEAQRQGAPTLLDGCCFKEGAPSSAVVTTEGLSDPEHWGRWSVARRVRLIINHLLPEDFELELMAVSYGVNTHLPVPIRAGLSMTLAHLPRHAYLVPVVVRLKPRRPTNVIDIWVPWPAQPSPVGPTVDTRKIGVGLVGVRLLGKLPTSPKAAQTDIVAAA
jgi:glycosyltransferase involved in cell wall biosynthesis